MQGGILWLSHVGWDDLGRAVYGRRKIISS